MLRTCHGLEPPPLYHHADDRGARYQPAPLRRVPAHPPPHESLSGRARPAWTGSGVDAFGHRPRDGGRADRRSDHRRRSAALPGPDGDRSPRHPRHHARSAGHLARFRWCDSGDRGLRRGQHMVNFKPTDEQELIRETMAGFARDVLRRHGREADERNEVPDEVVQRGWELGLVQAAVPEAFGGYGDTRSVLTGVLLIEELAYGDAALALHLLAPRLLTIPLIVLGTEAQRARWLPAFAGSEFRAGSAAFVEPRWNFDATTLAT